MPYPVSQRFKDTVLISHVIKSRVDILVDGIVEYTLETMTEGQVTSDFEQDSRGKANFTAVDEDGTLTPVDAASLLTPYGNEFQASRGIVYEDGTEEMVPLGIFGITSSEIQDPGPSLEIRCEGADRSDKIKRSKFRDTFSIAAGASIPDALLAIMGFIGVDFPTRLTPMEEQTTAKMVYDIGADPWEAMQQLATTCSCDLRFAYDGALELIALPTYDLMEPDWEFTDGENGNLLAVTRNLGSNDVSNWIVVTGENTGNTTSVPKGEAFDNNPDSPTYVYGKYGIVLEHVVDRGAVNNAQAQLIAQHMLQDRLGLVESVTGYFLCNPAVQVLDLVRVDRSPSKLEDVLIIVDQVSHPFVAIRGSQAMTRRRLYGQQITPAAQLQVTVGASFIPLRLEDNSLLLTEGGDLILTES